MDIKEIFNECLAKGYNSNCVIVEDLTTITIFDSNQLKKFQPEIEKQINKRPNVFKIFNKKNKWTKKHEKFKELYRLGVAIGKIKPGSFRKITSSQKIAS